MCDAHCKVTREIGRISTSPMPKLAFTYFIKIAFNFLVICLNIRSCIHLIYFPMLMSTPFCGLDPINDTIFFKKHTHSSSLFLKTWRLAVPYMQQWTSNFLMVVALSESSTPEHGRRRWCDRDPEEVFKECWQKRQALRYQQKVRKSLL